MESSVTDPEGQTELCDVIDEDDSHYRVTFTPKQNGKHILSIKHKAMHIAGKIYRGDTDIDTRNLYFSGFLFDFGQFLMQIV